MEAVIERIVDLGLGQPNLPFAGLALAEWPHAAALAWCTGGRP
jgi:hypothetical protein